MGRATSCETTRRGVRRARRANRTDLRWPPDRRLVLVDVENVVGGPCDTEARARWAFRLLGDVLGREPRDHVVVGVDGSGLASVGWVWCHARRVVGYGKDGADKVLLEVLSEDVARRFAHVILASGDGIFADTVAELTAGGVHLTVVAHECALSAQLRLVASEVVLLSRATRVPTPRSA